MTEHTLQNQIRVALSDYGICFRTNAGRFWQGKRVWSNEYNQYVLTDLKPVAGLPKGFSDTLFIGDNGKIAFIEIKTPKGRVRPEQEHFLDTMRGKGYKAGIARSVEDAIRIIND